MFIQTVNINHVPGTCMMDRCPSWTDPTDCWHAGKGYLSPGTHDMMDGARALPTGSLNKVISSYSAILTTLTSLLVSIYIYACVCVICVCVCVRAAKQILLPVREREMESTPCGLRTKLCSFSSVCAI